MDRHLIGVIITIGILFLIGFANEAWGKAKARKQALKLLGTRRQLDYEIKRSADALRKGPKA